MKACTISLELIIISPSNSWAIFFFFKFIYSQILQNWKHPTSGLKTLYKARKPPKWACVGFGDRRARCTFCLNYSFQPLEKKIIIEFSWLQNPLIFSSNFLKPSFLIGCKFQTLPKQSEISRKGISLQMYKSIWGSSCNHVNTFTGTNNS